MVKIYDGVTIDMNTSKVIKEGRVSYVDSSEVAYAKGGDKSSTATTGFSEQYKPQITNMLNTGQGLYEGGQLGSVAGFNQTQLDAQQAGIASAGAQTGLEQALAGGANQLAAQANKGVDLSGMRTGAQQQALQALGMNAAGAGRAGGLGGSRQYLNQGSIANDLAAKFGQIDQSAQAQNFANKQGALAAQQNALAAQGQGAQSLAQIGAGQQQQAQNIADAPYKGLSQYASLFHGVADKSTTTTQQGGK
jgi:hypothetical protein